MYFSNVMNALFFFLLLYVWKKQHCRNGIVSLDIFGTIYVFDRGIKGRLLICFHDCLGEKRVQKKSASLIASMDFTTPGGGE